VWPVALLAAPPELALVVVVVVVLVLELLAVIREIRRPYYSPVFGL